MKSLSEINSVWNESTLEDGEAKQVVQSQPIVPAFFRNVCRMLHPAAEVCIGNYVNCVAEIISARRKESQVRGTEPGRKGRGIFFN